MMTQNHTAKVAISADGKSLDPDVSLRQLAENNQLDTIEITIDGSRLLGGKKTPSLLGDATAFLTETKVYKLKSIANHDDGRCIVSYQRAAKV